LRGRFHNAAFYAVALSVALLLLEAGSYGIGRFVLAKSGVIYLPPDAAGYEHYLQVRDPVLGWPSPQEFGAGRYDAKGARVSPAFPDSSARPCVSVYGDSFAFSEEVDAAHAWPNLLAKMLHCRVDNFGVDGYGTDQAYLRYIQNRNTGRETAPIVVIVYWAENLMRNINQYHDLLYSHPDEKFSLKPRFVLSTDGRLTYIPLPNFTAAEFTQMLHNPARYLPHEYFLPDHDGGPRSLSFPYTLSLVRCFGNDHILSKLEHVPFFFRYYQADDPGDSMALTAEILKHFRDAVTTSGARPVVLMIPSGQDVRYFQREHIWTYAPLIQLLSQRGILPFNFGNYIISVRSGEDGCILFTGCDHHFNEQGNAFLALYVARNLSQAHEVSGQVSER
jgi:hypothetical protein